MIYIKQDTTPLKELALNYGRNQLIPISLKNSRDHFETVIEGVYFATSEVIGTKPDHSPIKIIGVPEAIAYGLISVEKSDNNDGRVVHILSPDIKLVIGLNPEK